MLKTKQFSITVAIGRAAYALKNIMRSAALSALTGLLVYPATTTAQTFPDRPIKIIVPFGAASGTDAVARAMGDELTKLAKVSILVENIPGANGILGSQAAAKAPPDGYTILMATSTTHAANAAMYKKLPYDPIKDFEPIMKTAEAPVILVVRTESPYRTVAEFMADVKARKRLSFGSSSAASRIAAEMIKSSLHGDLLNVPYKTSPQALTDLIGGQIDFMTIDLGPAMPLIKGGKLRALAVASLGPDAQLPGVPTLSNSGLKDFELVTFGGVLAPAGTPPRVVEQLNAWMRQVMESPKVRERLVQTGITAAASSPQEFRVFLEKEKVKWARAVKEAGIEPE